LFIFLSNLKVCVKSFFFSFCPTAHPSQARTLLSSCRSILSGWGTWFPFLSSGSRSRERCSRKWPETRRQNSPEHKVLIPSCKVCRQASWRELQSLTCQWSAPHPCSIIISFNISQIGVLFKCLLFLFICASLYF
jgi:hypothetical protein